MLPSWLIARHLPDITECESVKRCIWHLKANKVSLVFHSFYHEQHILTKNQSQYIKIILLLLGVMHICFFMFV